MLRFTVVHVSTAHIPADVWVTTYVPHFVCPRSDLTGCSDVYVCSTHVPVSTFTTYVVRAGDFMPTFAFTTTVWISLTLSFSCVHLPDLHYSYDFATVFALLRSLRSTRYHLFTLLLWLRYVVVT